MGAEHCGHGVALVEEPEKVAVSKNVGEAIDSLISAETYVQASEAFHYLFASRKKEDIKRIIKAIRNGYTVKKKKYNVKLTESEIEHYGLQDCEKEEVTDDGND